MQMNNSPQKCMSEVKSIVKFSDLILQNSKCMKEVCFRDCPVVHVSGQKKYVDLREHQHGKYG